MVVFTCNHCGEALHKPKVEKHYQFQCRNSKYVSCVDCFKDFRDEEYVAHIKCITEDERYAAKGTYKNGIVKKGEVKQESWLETIRNICETEKNLKPALRNLLNTISGYSNVPRKKNKFLNFIKSSSGGRVNMNDVEEVWNIIEKHKTANQGSQKVTKVETVGANNEQVSSSEKNNKRQLELENGDSKSKKKKSTHVDVLQISVQNDENSKKKKKSKKSETDTSSLHEQNGTNGIEIDSGKKKKKIKVELVQNDNKKEMESEQLTKEENDDRVGRFDFKQKILDVISSKGGEITLKRLQKKVLKAYTYSVGEASCTEKAIKKYSKKLSKLPNVKVENERAVLVN